MPKQETSALTFRQFMSVVCLVIPMFFGVVFYAYSGDIQALATQIENVEKEAFTNHLRHLEITQKNTERMENHAATLIVHDPRNADNQFEHRTINNKLDQIIITVEERGLAPWD